MKNEIRNIVIIGAGNLGGIFSKALQKAGINILQVISRSELSAYTLAKELNSGYTNDIKKINTNADLYIISVSDNSIPLIIDSVNWQNKFVVHTSGSTSIDVFKNKADSFGVIYPFQTFSKSRKLDFASIPIFIEANNKNNENILFRLCTKISGNMHFASSEERLLLHISAVFACNFTNHMFALAEQLLSKKNIPFGILKSLISETVEKALQNGPSVSQTGPASRNDDVIIEKHLDLLKTEKNLHKIYEILNKSIADKHKINNI